MTHSQSTQKKSVTGYMFSNPSHLSSPLMTARALARGGEICPLGSVIHNTILHIARGRGARDTQTRPAADRASARTEPAPRAHPTRAAPPRPPRAAALPAHTLPPRAQAGCSQQDVEDAASMQQHMHKWMRSTAAQPDSPIWPPPSAPKHTAPPQPITIIGLSGRSPRTHPRYCSVLIHVADLCYCRPRPGLSSVLSGTHTHTYAFCRARALPYSYSMDIIFFLTPTLTLREVRSSTGAPPFAFQ